LAEEELLEVMRFWITKIQKITKLFNSVTALYFCLGYHCSHAPSGVLMMTSLPHNKYLN